MFSCFPSLVFYSAGVQVFFGFKILDNQANAGQELRRQPATVLLFHALEEYLLFWNWLQGTRGVLYASLIFPTRRPTGPGSCPHGGASTMSYLR